MDIERESAWLKSPDLRLFRPRKDLSYLIEDLCVGCGIAPRRLPYRALINHENLVNLMS